jgi:hypothetical protein
MIQKLGNRKNWYVVNNHSFFKNCDTLMHNSRPVAYIMQKDRKTLWINTGQFNSLLTLKPLVEFINEYCEIPYAEPVVSKHAVYRFLNKEYNMNIPCRKEIKNTLQKDLTGLDT